MQEMHYSNLEFAFKNLEPKKQKRELILNERELTKNTFEGNGDQFFELSSLDTDSFFNTFEEKKVIGTLGAARISSYDLTNYADFTPAQKTVAQPFVNNVYNVNNTPEAYSLVSGFNSQVVNSALSQDEKLELLNLSSATHALGQFMDNWGTDQMYYFILTLGYEPYRMQGCSVNFRSVWASAVIGFFSGGATGGYIGCVGGTVGLPGFGTVTGCVSGAVFGATSGFVTGAAAGVAAELLTSCFSGRGGNGGTDPFPEEDV